MGFIAVKIKTIADESLIPTDKDKAIQDAVNEVKGTIKETGKDEATLANGESVTVYSLYSPQLGFYNNKAKLFGFMPDNRTIVTVLSATDKGKTEKLMKTLTIGEMPPT
ncbi:MAG: hypothetical protein LUQ47_00495 [Methanotrichaceae archaeon]|nr:hypothetical protein [Methanotrichaceae archaeon]